MGAYFSAFTYFLLNTNLVIKPQACIYHQIRTTSTSSCKLSTFYSGWKFPCSSQISPYVSRVESGMNTGISNPYNPIRTMLMCSVCLAGRWRWTWEWYVEHDAYRRWGASVLWMSCDDNDADNVVIGWCDCASDGHHAGRTTPYLSDLQLYRHRKTSLTWTSSPFWRNCNLSLISPRHRYIL